MTEALNADAQKAFVGTVAPEGSRCRLDVAKLSEWMEANVEGFQGPLEADQVQGRAIEPDLQDRGAKRAITCSAASPSACCCRAPTRSIANIRVQSGLQNSAFPVARQYGLCTDESVVGSWFYVMGMVDGRTIWDGSMPNDDTRISPRNLSGDDRHTRRSCTMSMSRRRACPISANPAIISGGRSIAGPSNIVCPKPRIWTSDGAADRPMAARDPCPNRRAPASSMAITASTI
jgi:hypothetical protein